jgi:hypothetical protein
MPEPTAPSYYDRRAPEYDDWYLGEGLCAGRERDRFDEELARVQYQRWFTPERLLEDFGGGDVLLAGEWFVVLRSPR